MDESWLKTALKWKVFDDFLYVVDFVVDFVVVTLSGSLMWTSVSLHSRMFDVVVVASVVVVAVVGVDEDDDDDDSVDWIGHTLR